MIQEGISISSDLASDQRLLLYLLQPLHIAHAGDLLGLGKGHQLDRHLLVGEHAPVDQRLDLAELLGGQASPITPVISFNIP